MVWKGGVKPPLPGSNHRIFNYFMVENSGAAWRKTFALSWGAETRALLGSVLSAAVAVAAVTVAAIAVTAAAAVVAAAAEQEDDRDDDDNPPGIVTEKTVIAGITHTK